MSENKTFEIGYVEYPRTALYYRPVKINTADYPELQGKTDKEIMEYIKENINQMKSTEEEYYDSLSEEIVNQDIIREKNPYSDSDIWVDVYSGTEDDKEEEEEEDDEEED